MTNWIEKLSSSLEKLTNWYFSKKTLPYWCVLALDCTAIVVAGMSAVYLCIGGKALAYNFWNTVLMWVCTLPLFFVGMRVFHTYSGVIRYSSFTDLMRVALSVVIGIVLTYVTFLIIPGGVHSTLPINRVLFITLAFAAIFVCGIRVAVKYVYDTIMSDRSSQHVFIYGVQQGGAALAKSMRNETPRRYLLMGFLSDEKNMIGRNLVGVDVYAANEDAIEVMRKKKATILFVSPLLSEQFRENDKLVDALTKAGIKIMMLPSAETWDGKSSLQHTQLHEVEIEDLLPRDKIEVDLKAIGQLLQDKRILITGAAGSIGSEMVRQVASFYPAELVLVDQAETPMHDVRRYMEKNYPNIKCMTMVTSISNKEHMEKLFKEHRPEYVFHAAAYKHVPMMENNPGIAVQNNIYGTRVIADLAVKYGTKKFVMISTDKAVNPTNVMGCSKRICEIYCQALNNAIQNYNKGRDANLDAESMMDLNFSMDEKLSQVDGSPAVTQFITTRFGNVLGSNGSVIPIFKEQIKNGGPVTVTDPRIYRYFMLIPEACQLVLEAGTMGNGGEIFVFDMGKQVRIAELAQRMIDLSGAKDVKIQYTGLRDGEKLFEETLSKDENSKETVHPKIKVAAVREYPYEQALKNEEELYKLSFTFDDMKIVAKMKEIVPEYKSQHSKYEALDAPHA